MDASTTVAKQNVYLCTLKACRAAQNQISANAVQFLWSNIKKKKKLEKYVRKHSLSIECNLSWTLKTSKAVHKGVMLTRKRPTK